MDVRVDAAGNLRRVTRGCAGLARLFIGSHLDTVPRAGAFDGMLGVVLGVALVDLLQRPACPSHRGRRLLRRGRRALRRAVHRQPGLDRRARRRDPGPRGCGRRQRAATRFAIRPRSRRPGSRARRGRRSRLPRVPHRTGSGARTLGLPLGVVETIVGQSRLDVTFTARPTTPAPRRWTRAAMRSPARRSGFWRSKRRRARRRLRRDGGTGRSRGPAPTNVIAGQVCRSLDVRHADDAVRRRAVDRLHRVGPRDCRAAPAGRHGRTAAGSAGRRDGRRALRRDSKAPSHAAGCRCIA